MSVIQVVTLTKIYVRSVLVAGFAFLKHPREHGFYVHITYGILWSKRIINVVIVSIYGGRRHSHKIFIWSSHPPPIYRRNNDSLVRIQEG